MAFSEVYFSSFVLKSCGLVTLYFSHHFRFMIGMVVAWCRKMGLTVGKTNSTVKSSILRGSPITLA